MSQLHIVVFTIYMYSIGGIFFLVFKAIFLDFRTLDIFEKVFSAMLILLLYFFFTSSVFCYFLSKVREIDDVFNISTIDGCAYFWLVIFLSYYHCFCFLSIHLHVKGLITGLSIGARNSNI